MSTGLPTLARTWQFTVNQAQSAQGTALGDNRQLLINLKNALLGFGTAPCTMRYSCNGTTAGTAGDGVDRIGTTQANLVYAAGAHSWFVIRQAGVGFNFEICFDLNSVSGTGANISLVISYGAGFTGGSTTARPTATDEHVILSATGFAGSVTVDQAFRWSVMQTTDGQSARLFAFASGSLLFSAGWDVPTDVVTGWTNPLVFWWISGSVTPASFITSSANMKARISSTNAAVFATSEFLVTTYAANEATIGNIANEVDGNWPFWPAGVASNVVGVRGRHARLQDFWFGSNSIPPGDSYPATGTTGQFAQAGGLIVPWNGGVVNTS